MREKMAIALCIGSAAVGAFLIHMAYSRSLVLLFVAIAWGFACDQLRTGKRVSLAANMTEIHAAAQRGELRMTPFGRLVSYGFCMLLIAAIVCLFV